MSSKKTPGKDPSAPLCVTCLQKGVRLPLVARFGEPPEYCSNHDPAQVERRAAAGAHRRPRFGPDGVDPRSMPTVDFIVDYAIATAERVERGELAPDQGQKVGYLLRTAIDGLKARGHVGDLQPKVGSKAPDVAPETAASSGDDPMGALKEGLDS